MNFDRMGRRVFYKEEVAGVVTKHHKFVYDNYLCVQKLDALNNNSQMNLFVWDPTEPIATRPLFTTGSGNRKFFYTCDGNKNVSELVHFETRNGIAAHYDYAPFGAVTRAIPASAITDNTFTTDNPFRFSSEHHDDTLGLVYYNYRHYNPLDGRWCERDLVEEINLYLQCQNSLCSFYDWLGLSPLIFDTDVFRAINTMLVMSKAADRNDNLGLPIPTIKGEPKKDVTRCLDWDECPVNGRLSILEVTVEVIFENYSKPSAIVPIWYKATSKEDEQFFKKIREIVLEHENEHVAIWMRYRDELLGPHTFKYKSCADEDLRSLADGFADNMLVEKYREVSARFIKENNAFQRDEEIFGRHQTVNKMIKNYQMRKQ